MDETTVHALFPEIQKDFHSFVSPCASLAAGGILTLVSRRLDLQDGRVSCQCYAPGRVHRVSIATPSRTTFVWNVHNFALLPKELSLLCKDMAADIATANSEPSGYNCIVGGDFNFGPHDVPTFRPELVPTAGPANRAILTPRQGQRAFENALADATEISPTAHTHFDLKHNSFSGIDRVFVTTPPWALLAHQVCVNVHACPQQLRALAVSDHSPVTVTFRLHNQKQAQSHAIPASIFRDPLFKQMHDVLVDELALDSMPTVQRWGTHKLIIREAARRTRNDMICRPAVSQGPDVELIALNSIARAVARNDWKLARMLVRTSAMAADVLDLTGSLVSLQNWQHFTDKVVAARRQRLESMVATQRQLGAHPKKRRTGTQRLAQLWAPHAKRLVLHGIAVTNAGRVTVHRADRNVPLQRAWSEVFTATPVDVDLGAKFARQWCIPLDHDHICPPGTIEISKFLQRAPASAPGPDGLPYDAWRYAGLAGATTLAGLERHLRSGLRLGLDFSSSLAVFLPKGDCAGDDQEVIRSPSDVRPLGLKNIDNKTICAVWNHALRPQIARQACSLQRGFVAGRQLLENITDLDAEARVYGHPSDAHLLPILVLFDFCAAFPSVALSWVWTVLDAMQFHPGLRAFFEGVYHLNSCVLPAPSGLEFMCWVTAGVLQGCPLSGLIFVLVIDPLLRAIQATIDKQKLGMTRACADDVGCALRSAASLCHLHDLFKIIERVANLRLKPSKCNIVPLWRRFSLHVTTVLKDTLRAKVPLWQAFNIVPYARYQGFWLGPAATDCMQWAAPLEKLKERVARLVASGVPPSTCTLQYAIRCLPVLGYVAQLVPLRQARGLEVDTGCKLLRLPGRALPADALLHLHEVGCLRIQSLSAACLAALLRTAVGHTICWAPTWDRLLELNEQEVNMNQWRKRRPWSEHWCAPSFVHNLWLGSRGLEARQGEPRSSRCMQVALHAALAAKAEGRPIQSVIYASLVAQRPFDVADHLLRSVRSYIPGLRLMPSSLRSALRKFSPQTSLHAVRFCVGGWPTARRMHSSPLPCFFCGSPNADDMEHYLKGCTDFKERATLWTGSSFEDLEVINMARLTEVYLGVRKSLTSPLLQSLWRAAVAKHPSPTRLPRHASTSRGRNVASVQSQGRTAQALGAD